MTRTFIMTKIFDKNWNKFGLTDDDLQKFEVFIMQNPNAGDVIEGTGGLTKIRWNLPNKGKSDGVRVLYVDFTHKEKVIFINCYSKHEKDDITNREKAIYKDLINEIRKELI